MVFREICERSTRKVGVARAVLMNRVGGDFHYTVRRPRRNHFAVDFVESIERRGRITRIKLPRKRIYFNGRYIATLAIRRGT